MDEKYPENLLLKGKRFNESKKKDKSKAQPEESIVERVKLRKQKADDMPPLEGDGDKVKEGKGLKICTRNKLLIRPPILQAQIKAGNNSYKLKK